MNEKGLPSVYVELEVPTPDGKYKMEKVGALSLAELPAAMRLRIEELGLKWQDPYIGATFVFDEQLCEHRAVDSFQATTRLFRGLGYDVLSALANHFILPNETQVKF